MRSDKALLHFRDGGDPLLGEPVGRLVAGDPLLVRDLEDAQDGVVNLPGFVTRPLQRPAVQLGVDVDQAAAVDHVVGCVQDAAPGDGWPDLPSSPVTCWVSTRMNSMSWVEVPTSSAVM